MTEQGGGGYIKHHARLAANDKKGVKKWGPYGAKYGRNMNDIRVLVADSHPVTREEISAILRTDPDIELIGNAASIQEAIALAQEYQPDILLLDLKMPGIQPGELAARLSLCCPQTKILTLSDAWSEVNLRVLVMAGILGYVDKIEVPEKIINAIHTVADGGIWLSQTALDHLIDKDDEPTPAKAFGLTDRELEVLRQAAVGKTNREIALTLEISVKTVEKCLTTIYEKLEVGSRVEAAVWAVRNNLA